MKAVRILLPAAVLLSMLFGAAAEAPPQRLERPERIVLSTGATCLYHRDDASPTTVVQVFLRGGRGAVPSGSDGLAYLATSLCLEIPDEGKVRDLMAQATRLYLSVWEDFSIIHLECLSENLDAALRVASGIIQEPLLTGIRIDRTKRTMILRGRSQQDDAETVARNAVMRALFGDGGYGTSAFGSEDTLRTLGRKEVAEFRRRFFHQAGLFFAVGSDLGPDRVRALLEEHFDGIPRAEPSELSVQAPRLPEDPDIVLTRKTKQTYLGRAFTLPAPGPAVYAKALLLETALGRGPGSRLWDLRATEKLAYNVSARTIWTRASGVLEAYLETDTAKAGEASAALDEALEALRVRGLSEEELAAARAMAAAHFLRSVETKPVRTRMAGTFEVLGLGAGYLADIFEALEAVTPDALTAFIQDVLGADKALRIRIGPDAADGERIPQGG